MGDEAHVGLVDSHPESDGGADDDAFLAPEAGLVLPSSRRVQSRVVGQRRDAVPAEELRRLLRLLAAQAIDDPGIARVPFAQEREQLLLARLFQGDLVLDVRPVEARSEDLGVEKPEAALHFLAGQRIGGGRRRVGRPVWAALGATWGGVRIGTASSGAPAHTPGPG